MRLTAPRAQPGSLKLSLSTPLQQRCSIKSICLFSRLLHPPRSAWNWQGAESYPEAQGDRAAREFGASITQSRAFWPEGTEAFWDRCCLLFVSSKHSMEGAPEAPEKPMQVFITMTVKQVRLVS